MNGKGSQKWHKAAFKKTSQSLARCVKIANGYRQRRQYTRMKRFFWSEWLDERTCIRDSGIEGNEFFWNCGRNIT